ncbi:uncharacterized protein BO87DRAFT_392950 [Aspergillus neoniger CBS 115656]|uniref:Secreted protein n=1 Tax=Aspergillus neoniger (strain CBS 115656) TaxID=1448310 RepID=A0A318YZ74_ASPNB|nr:hypothetical protein BO87DRAFT_392950 [Aspergillus neoniger CBS 115656]PYH39307.1 hypothetical protein BO87DRAFT_392950 [Aspergillus neoniger CBS 115656]
MHTQSVTALQAAALLTFLLRCCPASQPAICSIEIRLAMPLDKTICGDGVVVDQTSLARSRIQGWTELASLTPAGSETPADRLEGEVISASKGLIWNPREESRILGWAFLGLQERMETRDGDEINDFMMMWLTIVDFYRTSGDNPAQVPSGLPLPDSLLQILTH